MLSTLPIPHLDFNIIDQRLKRKESGVVVLEDGALVFSVHFGEWYQLSSARPVGGPVLIAGPLTAFRWRRGQSPCGRCAAVTRWIRAYCVPIN